MPTPDSRRLCLVSTNSRLALGGLATYADRLCSLAAETYETWNIARFEGSEPHALDPMRGETPRGWADELGELRIIAPESRRRHLLRLTGPFMHRRPLQGLAIKTFVQAYQRPLAETVPPATAVMHFVGAGWELLGFPVQRMARARRIPFTIWPAVHPGQWGDSNLDARLYREADTIFAQSRYESARLQEIGVPTDRVRICPLGPSVQADGHGERFRQTYRLGHRPVVLFVGRKQRYKGFHDLCEAMPAVLEQSPDAVLVAVGQMGEEPFRSPPSGSYLDLGACDDALKADATAACDVFCMPSIGEAFGIAYVDAWSYGKPVITGPAPAPAEMVEDSGGGLSVPQAPRDIAGAVNSLLLNRGLASELGRRGAEHQAEHYTWERMWKVHCDSWNSN